MIDERNVMTGDDLRPREKRFTWKFVTGDSYASIHNGFWTNNASVALALVMNL